MTHILLLLSFWTFIGLTPTVSAAHFNCDLALLAERGFTHEPLASEVIQPSLEMSLAFAIHALKLVNPEVAEAFKARAFKALSSTTIVDEQSGPLATPFRLVFPSTSPYVLASRIPLRNAPTIVWPRHKLKLSGITSRWLEAALLAVKLVFEVENHQALPPTLFRVWRHANGAYRKFLNANAESLYIQSHVFEGVKAHIDEHVQISGQFSPNRWLAISLFRDRSNPFFYNMILPPSLAEKIYQSSEEFQKSSIRDYLESRYHLVNWGDRLVSGTETVGVAGTLALGALLAVDSASAINGISPAEPIPAPAVLNSEKQTELRRFEELTDAELLELMTFPNRDN